jgi:hypothetical protein
MSMDNPDTDAGLATQGVTTIVRQAAGDPLLVSAWGRTCSIDMQFANSMMDLQAALQRTLQMEGQAFHICDINGELLSTDMQVQDAIAQGLTPLAAMLPDKSLHHLENRREELAQMQWKLVRDQMKHGDDAVKSLNRQVTELQLQLKALRTEMSSNLDRIRGDTAKALDFERTASKAELLPVQEAVNGAVLLINGERSKRELSVQGFEKHIHGVCDMLDGERTSRRQDMAMHTSVLQELRANMESERAHREALEEQVKEMMRYNEKWQLDTSANISAQAGRIQTVQADQTASLTDISARFLETEDRSSAIENSISETTTWTTESLDKLGKRIEGANQSSETLRFGAKSMEGGIANCLERLNEMENVIRQHRTEVDDWMKQEQSIRGDQVRRSGQMATSEQRQQIAEIEKRISVRIEQESAEREKNYQTLIEEVSRVVDDRKLFRDQTITKTVTLASAGSTVVSRSGDLVAVDSPVTSFQPVSPSVAYLDGTQERVLRTSIGGSPLAASARTRSMTPQKVPTLVGTPSCGPLSLPVGARPPALSAGSVLSAGSMLPVGGSPLARTTPMSMTPRAGSLTSMLSGVAPVPASLGAPLLGSMTVPLTTR